MILGPSSNYCTARDVENDARKIWRVSGLGVCHVCSREAEMRHLQLWGLVTAIMSGEEVVEVPCTSAQDSNPNASSLEVP